MSTLEQTGTVIKPHVPESAWIRIAKVLTLLSSLGIIFMGVTVGCLYLLLSVLAPQKLNSAPLSSGVAGFSIFALSLTLGGALLFQSVSALSRRPSSGFHLPHPIIFALAFIATVSLGALITWMGNASWVIFPIFYVLGIGLPIGWVMAAAGERFIRAGTRFNWREAILQLSSGAFITTSIAVFFEAMTLLGVIIVVFMGILVTPGGLESLEALSENLQQPGWIETPENLQNLLFSPAVIISLFFLMSVAVPLIEEMLKTVGVLLMSYRRPSKAQALWWGLLGGAGFAFAEGLFNSNLAIGDMSWAVLAPMRFGTTILHCLTGALMGLGWYALFFDKKPLQWLNRYVQAVVVHGIWNAFSLGLAFTSPSLSASGDKAIATAATPGFILTGILFLQAVLMALLLLQIIHRTLEAGQVQNHQLIARQDFDR